MSVMSAGIAGGVSTATRSPDNPVHLGDVLTPLLVVGLVPLARTPCAPVLSIRHVRRSRISPTNGWSRHCRRVQTAPVGEYRRHPDLGEEVEFSMARRRQWVTDPC